MVAPAAAIERASYEIHFEPYMSERRLDEFDDAILFQGLFEDKEYLAGLNNEGFPDAVSDSEQLARRHAEVERIVSEGRYCCFILCEPFLDDRKYLRNSDLTKLILNRYDVRRANFKTKGVPVEATRAEFAPFLMRYGCATSYVEATTHVSPIATRESRVAGFVLDRCWYYVPARLPGRDSVEAAEYFSLLAEAMISADEGKKGIN